MADGVQLRELEAADRPVIEALWQLYRHDLSEVRGTHGPEGFRGMLPGVDGRFHQRTLEPFLVSDTDRAAYLLESEGRPVGLAFASGLAGERRLVAEFFVVRGLRRRGAGRAAAIALFRRHPGVWDVPFQEANTAAAHFWRRLAAELCGEHWREERRQVPGKPEVPPDVWIELTVGEG